MMEGCGLHSSGTG